MAHPDTWSDSAYLKPKGAEAISRDVDRQPHYIIEKRRYNDSLPLHQLPVEVIVKFLYRALQGKIRWYFSKLHILWQVCTTWAEVIQTEPSFWGMAQSHYPQTILTTALQRSKNTPLDVQDISPWVPSARGDFFSLVSKHAGRWRSAEFEHLAREKLDILTTLSVPSLEDLSRNNSGRHHVDRTPRLLEGDLHRLRHLKIAVYSVRWEGLANLETLDLQFHSLERLSADQLLGILASSPSLKKHRLYMVHVGHPSASPPSVVLQQLKKLEIVQYLDEGDEMIDVIAAIRVPCTDLIISAHDIQISMPHLVKQCRELLMNAEVIAIRLEEMHLSVTASSCSGGITRRISATSAVTSPEPWYISILPSPPLPEQEFTLEIEARNTEAPWDWMLHVMTTTPQISVLNVLYEVGSNIPAALIAFLGTPETVTHGGVDSLQWPFLKLRSLWLADGAPDQVALKKMLQERYGRLHPYGEHGKRQGHGVAALTRLRIDGTEEPAEVDVQALRDILGSDAVGWNGSPVLWFEPVGRLQSHDV